MPSLGAIRFHDSVDPALDSGRYRVVSRSDTRDAGRPVDESVQHLEIVGPRFALEAGHVLARYPAPQAVGGFGEDLPYLVLSRRSLPWERHGFGTGAPAGTPWMTLLVLRADECELRQNVPLAQVVGAARAARFIPQPPVAAVTLKAPRTLAQVLARPPEVGLLSHVREVNLADTALAMADDDGWFAVVVANRVALGSSGAGTPYVACLVSLEERDDLAGATPATQSLVVLDSWRFTATMAGGTFRRLVREADRGLLGQGAPTASGHVFLDAVDRSGLSSTVAYRGPLLAHPSSGPTATIPGPAGSPVVDRSLAVARELGRLLAAADGRFLREVIAWRRGNAVEGAAGVVSNAVAASLGATASGARLVARHLGATGRGRARRESLPALAGVGALLRVLGHRPRAANPWGVPAPARAEARRLSEAARRGGRQLPAPDASAPPAPASTSPSSAGRAAPGGPSVDEERLGDLRRARDLLAGEAP